MIAFIGAPVWWILGLFQAIFFVASAIIVLRLARRRDIHRPKLFSLWLLFLVWSLGGLFTLQVDAPGAVPGESMGRYLTFAYRYAWYTASGLILLHIVNSRRSLSSDTIAQALSWFFVVLVGGGILGLIAPLADFPSLLEALLPQRITQIPLAQELIHPNTAQVQSVLGYPEARPSAPFAYTNEWGMAVALTLPFFVHVWWQKGVRTRMAAVVILAIASIPIVASLNRGLWLSLLIITAFTAIRSAFLGNVRTLVTLVILAVAAGFVVVGSPLGGTVQERVDTPHSDEGRANLSLATVNSALEGSPFIGFGSTRDVEGNFSSIAGGASAECPGCSPPPLGTHGQAWLLIFATGFGGFLLYLVFIGGYFVRHLPSRSPIAIPSLAALLTALVTMPIYGAGGVSLVIIFTAIGLLARLEVSDKTGRPPATMSGLLLPIRRSGWLVAVSIAMGATTGLVIHAVQGQSVTVAQSVLVPAADMAGEPDARELSLDSEAQLATSRPVLSKVSDETGLTSAEISRHLSVGVAAPNTRVLTLTYQGSDERVAQQALDTAMTEYLALRSDLHVGTESGLQERFAAQYDRLSTAHAELETTLMSSGFSSPTTESALQDLRTQMTATTGSIDSLTSSRDLGTRITGMTVQRSNDAFIVRLGSAITISTVIGLIVAFFWGMRRAGSNATRRTPEIRGLRSMAWDYEPDKQQWDQQYLRRLRSFPPLGVIIPDASSADAVEVGDFLENKLQRQDPYKRRTLLLISTQTTLHQIGRMLDECRGMSLNPVGIIILETRSH